MFSCNLHAHVSLSDSLGAMTRRVYVYRTVGNLFFCFNYVLVVQFLSTCSQQTLLFFHLTDSNCLLYSWCHSAVLIFFKETVYILIKSSSFWSKDSVDVLLRYCASPCIFLFFLISLYFLSTDAGAISDRDFLNLLLYF